jgi:hypothetical protein
MDDLINDMTIFTPMKQCPPPSPPVNYEHYAMPMIHPTTGELISSYKRLMNNPNTAEVWMTAFGKDFSGMSQGDNKKGQKGTNAMFVMSLQDIPNIPKDRIVAYARVVVNHCPQKTDPNHIRINAGGNLINYPGKLATRTADITTSKLHWNSVLSTPGAKYMCLDIKNFYLLAPLDRYKCMRIPFPLFPHGSLSNMASPTRYTMDTFTWRCDERFGASPKLVYWPTSSSRSALPHTDTTNANKLPAFGNIPHGPFPSP